MMPVHTPSNDIVAILANPLFQALLTSGEASVDEESGLIIIQQRPIRDMKYLAGLRAQLQDLQRYIEQNVRSQELIQNITFQRILSFVHYKCLFTHGILTLDKVFALNSEQIKSLDRLKAFVRESLDVGPGGNDGMLASEEHIAGCVDKMLNYHIISKQDMFNFPDITYLSPSLCSLIVKGKISFIQAQLLTEQQKVNFSGNNTYCLILADILTVTQVARLSFDKLCRIERLNLREIKANDVFNKNLCIAVQQEAIQYIKNVCNPQTSQSFMLFNQTMMDMERRHINTHVWHQIKERVATRMWDKYHFLFLSQSDPGFIERIDAGQDIKLARSSEVQALLASSEGYRQYVRHTMFHSRFFRPVMSAQEESSGYEIAPISVS
tara:strand:- start:1511 stop:2653 length:1143 start_codon:yes stop_codon:yes gene_type:complete